MTSTATDRTAYAYIDRDYIASGTTTDRTTTSPGYISQDWASERSFNLLWADNVADEAQQVQERIDRATQGVETQHAEALATAAQDYARLDDKDVLRVLASEHAFTWVDLSRMIRVSVPAIRKWRHDGGLNAENRAKLIYLAAFAQLLRDKGIRAASWMSIPLLPGYTVAPKHLYTSDHAATLFDLACGWRTPTEVLNALDPDWRNTYDAHGYAVERFDDGTYGIVSK